MSIKPDPSALETARGLIQKKNIYSESVIYADIFRAAAAAPLSEILPAAPGDRPAATGFALAWASIAQKNTKSILWTASDASLAEEGAPCAEGLAQFGLS